MSPAAAPLTAELDLLRRAIRQAPAAAAPIEAPENHSVITAAAAGDNVLLSPTGRTIEITEIFIWNAKGAQTLTLRDGAQVLLTLTDAPISGGLLLGFTGTGKPHFTVTAGNAFILNLSIGTLVNGFIKYRT